MVDLRVVLVRGVKDRAITMGWGGDLFFIVLTIPTLRMKIDLLRLPR
jgi:hypothetical protein